MSLEQLAAHACGHYLGLLLSYGLAAYIAQKITEYFLNPKRDPIDESMAGACNGLKISCPQCQKVAWDPLPWPEVPLIPEAKQQATPQQPNESKDNEAITVVAAKQDASVDTATPKETTEKIEESPTP